MNGKESAIHTAQSIGQLIDGVGPEEPIIEDAKGYRSSKTPYCFQHGPIQAILRIAAITQEGVASHGPGNWRRGEVNDHLNKMLAHAFAYLAGDTSDDHLGHMAWRACAALEIDLVKKNSQDIV